MQSFLRWVSYTNQKYEITHTADKSIIHYYKKTITFDWFFEINKCGHKKIDFGWSWSKWWSIWIGEVGGLTRVDNFILLIWISDVDKKFMNKRYLKKLIFINDWELVYVYLML